MKIGIFVVLALAACFANGAEVNATYNFTEYYGMYDYHTGGSKKHCTKGSKKSGSKKCTHAPTHSPTAPVPCSDVSVIITTDDNPSQNYYKVTDKMGKVVMESGPFTDKRKSYTLTRCLPCGNYLFTIYDTAGNGICCASGPGGFNVYANNVLVEAGGPFMYDHTVALTTCTVPVPPTPVPTKPVTTAPVAPKPVTTAPVTAAPKPVTTAPVTAKPVPTAPKPVPVPPTNAPTNAILSVSTNKLKYNLGEAITVNFVNPTPNTFDWVGIYDCSDTTNNWKNYLTYIYTGGLSSGSEIIEEGISKVWPLPASCYFARYYNEKDVLLTQSQPFNISPNTSPPTPPTPPTVSPPTFYPTFTTGAGIDSDKWEYGQTMKAMTEQIIITFVNNKPTATDMISIVDCDTESTKLGERSTNGLTSGKMALGPYPTAPAGCYLAVYRNSKEQKIAEVEFTIKAPITKKPTTAPTNAPTTKVTTSTITTSKTNYNLGEPVVVNFVRPNPSTFDYISIFDTKALTMEVTFLYTGGRSSGFVEYEDKETSKVWPLPAGTHVARLYDGKDTLLVESKPFNILSTPYVPPPTNPSPPTPYPTYNTGVHLDTDKWVYTTTEQVKVYFQNPKPTTADKVRIVGRDDDKTYQELPTNGVTAYTEFTFNPLTSAGFYEAQYMSGNTVLLALYEIEVK